MILPFFFPLRGFCDSRVRKGEQPSGECPPPDSDPFNGDESGKISLGCQAAKAATANRRFKFHKMQSAFHRHGQRSVSRHRDVRPIQIVRPSESTAETQPKLQPASWRLSALVSQYFTAVA